MTQAPSSACACVTSICRACYHVLTRRIRLVQPFLCPEPYNKDIPKGPFSYELFPRLRIERFAPPQPHKYYTKTRSAGAAFSAFMSTPNQHSSADGTNFASTEKASGLNGSSAVPVPTSAPAPAAAAATAAKGKQKHAPPAPPTAEDADEAAITKSIGCVVRYLMLLIPRMVSRRLICDGCAIHLY
jgi:hypothetical protein